MAYTQIRYEAEGRIGRITINRPEKRNALTVVAMEELVDALTAVRNDANLSLGVVTGAGDQAFCAGADMNDFMEKDTIGKRDQNESYRRLVRAFMKVGKPLVAAVNGLALAGGLGLTLVCDLVVASDKARFGLPEIKVGFFPMMVMANLFRVVGRRKALDLLYTGRLIDAQEAERIGLVTRVVPHAALTAEVEKLVSELSQMSPAALSLGKQAFMSSSDMGALQALDYLREIATIASMTDDAREGMAAFLEKRKPSFKGR